jgi:uncharacterized membrane protein
MPKQANSIIWGSVGALIGAIAAALSQFVPGMAPMPQTIGQAALGGFFFGWVAAEVRNWMARR